MIGPSNSNLEIRPGIDLRHNPKYVVSDQDGNNVFDPNEAAEGTVQQPVGTYLGAAHNYETDNSNDLTGVNQLDFTDNTFFEAFTSGKTWDDYRDCDFTTLDMVRIRREILQLQAFTSPWQHIAADMNLDGKVSTRDLVPMREIILRRANLRVQCEPWYYINHKYFESMSTEELSDFADDPFDVTIGGEDYPEYLYELNYATTEFSPLNSYYNANWTWHHGVKMGQVTEWSSDQNDHCNVIWDDDCYRPTDMQSVSCFSENLNAGLDKRKAVITPSTAVMLQGQEYIIEISNTQELQCLDGFEQFYDYNGTALEVLRVESDLIAFDSSSYHVMSDLIGVLWIGEPTTASYTIPANTVMTRLRVKALANINNLSLEFSASGSPSATGEYVGMSSCMPAQVDLSVSVQSVSPLPMESGELKSLNVDQLTLLMQKGGQVEIVPALGGQVLQIRTSEWDRNALSPGSYFIRISRDGELRTYHYYVPKL